MKNKFTLTDLQVKRVHELLDKFDPDFENLLLQRYDVMEVAELSSTKYEEIVDFLLNLVSNKNKVT